MNGLRGMMMGSKTIQREMDSSVKHSAIWALVTIGVVALIGGFWGADGFMFVGMGLACLCGFAVVVIAASNGGLP